jgi:DNA-binding CsgD family transcriptional regulator
MAPDLFVGRVAELDQIAETLRQVAGGEPWLVEYHLGNIYGKYGIHSRRELRRLVGQWRAAAVV